MTTKFKRKMSAHEGLMIFIATVPGLVILILVAYVIGFFFT
jgi:hypothetical protein